MGEAGGARGCASENRTVATVCRGATVGTVATSAVVPAGVWHMTQNAQSWPLCDGCAGAGCSFSPWNWQIGAWAIVRVAAAASGSAATTTTWHHAAIHAAANRNGDLIGLRPYVPEK